MNDQATGDNTLVASVVRSIDARGKEITNSDQAAVDLALRYAVQIDAGIEAGGQAATKALYLGPHLLNTLKELGCTPEARRAAMPPTQQAAGARDKVTKSKLSAVRQQRDRPS